MSAAKVPGTVSVIDGATNSVVSVGVGSGPVGAAVNATTNTIYVPNFLDKSVSVIAGATAAPLQFVAVTPCRVVDTRIPMGRLAGPRFRGEPSGILPSRMGACNIPATVAAYSLNVTVVPPGPLGYLTIWPTGENQPVASTLNSLDGRIKANAAIVPAGYQGAVSVFVTNTTDVVLDIDGYFAPVGCSTLAFYPLTPCRVADTRNSNYPQGLGPPFLTGQHAARLSHPQCHCIPHSGVTPQAYSLNFSAVPHGALGYLTVWPTGQTQPVVSTLNDADRNHYC